MSRFSHPSRGSSQVDLLDLGFDENPAGGAYDADDSKPFENDQVDADGESKGRESASPSGGQHAQLSTISFNAADEAGELEQQNDGALHGRNFLDKLVDPSASAREYEVVFGLSTATVDGRPDLGLTMEADFYGNQAVVKGFSLVNGRVGPAQACGLICVGDVLVAVDGDRVRGMSFSQTLYVVRQACRAGGQLRLTFTAGTGEELKARGDDSEMLEARWFIHQQKARYYRPPPPSEDMVYCSLERHRGEKVTSFHLHRDDTGEFLLACSVGADLLGPMLFHTLQDSHLRDLRDIPTESDSAVYIGCMVPNFLGTEFRLLDHRINPRNSAIMDFVGDKGKNELGAVVYGVNVMGRVPNSMKVLLRRPRATATTGAIGVSGGEDEYLGGDDGSEKREWGVSVERGVYDEPIIKRWEDLKNKNKPAFRPSSPLKSLSSMWNAAFGDEETHRYEMQEREEAQVYSQLQSEGNDIITFETLSPSWNEALSAWTLNFNGRVKIPSKKNFLVAPEKGNQAMEQDFGEGKVHIRHGKMSKSRFSVDFRHPVSPIVALGVCCSTFAKKLTVT